MTQTVTPEQQRVACAFLRDTLAGQLRPELVPQMGPWQEVGRILLEALANDGLPTARRIFTTLCKHDPRLIPLVSADPPDASPVEKATIASPAPVQQTATATQVPAAASVASPAPVQQTPTARQVPAASVASPAPVQQTATAPQAPAAASVTLPTLTCPPLPDHAQLPEHLGATASRWLDDYIAFSRTWSPQGYDGFHEAVGLWILSTVAARRVMAPLGGKRYTPLYIALVAKTGLYAKSTTASLGYDVLQAAQLDWLLAPDDMTPQKFISDLVGRVPANYHQLAPSEEKLVRQRLAMPAQRGWFYDEFGQFLSGMTKEGNMADFRGILRRFDDCKPSYEYSTISRGSERVESPYLALLASMTPADLRSVAGRGSSLWSDGFLPRFALITPPKGERLKARFPDDLRMIPTSLVAPLQEWHTRLGVPEVSIRPITDDKGRTTISYSVERGDLPEHCCPLGEGVLDAFYTYNEALRDMIAQGHNDDLDGNYVRFSEKALRIAVLLASLGNNGLIEMPHWARAQAICERWRASLHELISQLNETGPAEDEILEEKIIQTVQRLGLVTVREMKQQIRGIDTPRLRFKVQALAYAGVLEEVKSEQTVRYRLPAA